MCFKIPDESSLYIIIFLLTTWCKELDIQFVFCFVTIAAAWNLEEDEDSGIASGSTDGAPFGYTTGGLYYSTDVHLQTLHTLVGIQNYHDSVRSVFLLSQK